MYVCRISEQKLFGMLSSLRAPYTSFKKVLSYLKVGHIEIITLLSTKSICHLFSKKCVLRQQNTDEHY